MMEILKSMVKEEWRVHSTMFGSLMFAFFPVLIMIFAFAGTFFIPLFYSIIPSQQMVLLVQYVFMLFGLSIGAFGLLGREIMNRRFGSASLVAYSSRTLPVSIRTIFANFIVKDILYYFILWILPFVAGFFFASFFLSISLVYSAVLLLTLTLSFLTGLSAIFLLSTVYAHSVKLLLTLLAAAAVIFVFSLGFIPSDILALLPSYSFFFHPSFAKIMASVVLIAVPFSLSMAFLKIDYPEKKREFRNSFDGLSSAFGFSRQSSLMAKDLLDLKRSEGGFGKIIFSLVFPMVFIWIIIYVFTSFFPRQTFSCFFPFSSAACLPPSTTGLQSLMSSAPIPSCLSKYQPS